MGDEGGQVLLHFLVSATGLGLTMWWNGGQCGGMENFVEKQRTMWRNGEESERTEDGEGGEQRTAGLGEIVGEGGRLVLHLLVYVLWALTHAAWNALMHALWGNTSCRPHVLHAIAVARKPRPNAWEDEYIRSQLRGAARVKLRTDDPSVISIVGSDVTFHLRGYLIQSDRSRVKYDQTTANRTAFEYGRATGDCVGVLSWDRFLFLSDLLDRLGIECRELPRHRELLQLRDRLHRLDAGPDTLPPSVHVAGDHSGWLRIFHRDGRGERALQQLTEHLKTGGFSRYEGGEGRVLAASLGPTRRSAH